jgi:CBS domain-containing protein
MNTYLKDVLPKRELVSFDESLTIEQCLKKLNQQNILAAPVTRNNNTEVLGFVDVLDLLAFLVNVSTKIMTTLDYGESKFITTDSLNMITRRNKEFKLTSVRDVIDLSKRNPFYQLKEDNRLKDAIDLFVGNRVHRLAIMDSNNRLCGILSQLDVIHYLFANKAQFKDFLKENELLSQKFANIEKHETITIGKNAQAIEAFMKMHENGVSAIGVTDDSGNVFGILSSSDIKCGIENDFKVLLDPVGTFLQNVRSQQNKNSNYLVSCNQDTPLGEILNTLNKEEIHRLIILDNNKKASGVLTLTDFFNCVFRPVEGAQVSSR